MTTNHQRAEEIAQKLTHGQTCILENSCSCGLIEVSESISQALDLAEARGAEKLRDLSSRQNEEAYQLGKRHGIELEREANARAA